MDGVLGRVLLGPEPGEQLGGGGRAPEAAPVSGNGPGAAPEPVLDSTAGFSAEDLSQRPAFDDGRLSGGSQGPGGGGAAVPPAPADPNIAAGAGAAPLGQEGTPPAGTGSSPGIREAALAYGLDLSSFQDDSQAWAYMVQAAQRGTERNYYAELGQQIAPHYQQIQQFLQQQQPVAAAQEKPPAWKHPEYDQRWMGLVERDPNTGTYRAKPGINPQFAEKVQQYHDSIDGWATGIVQDPETSLGPLIRQVAGQLLEERFGAQAVQQEAQAIYQQNESWLYQTDPAGQRQFDAAGRAVPSALGARYYSHLQTLRQAGVTEPRTLDTLAKNLLQADVLGAQQQQAHLQQQQRSVPAAAVAQPNRNTGQALEPVRRDQLPGGSQPSYEGLSLSDRLRRDLEAAGVSDADFQSMS